MRQLCPDIPMGRLTNLKPQIGGLAPRIARQSDDHGHSKAAEPWRAWYSLKRWRVLRWEVLKRDGFTCRVCQRLEGNTAHLVADHIRPHRGDPALFWAEANLQTLCAACHNADKQREERKRPGA